jgi:hypothetical protein
MSCDLSEPLVVTFPHRLGKDEALLRNIKAGLGRAKIEFAWLLSLEEVWTGDRLAFRAAAMGQRAQGTIDVSMSRWCGSRSRYPGCSRASPTRCSG